MSAKFTKKLYKFIVAVVLIATLTGCNNLDNAINGGINGVFGNDPTCSGIVC